MQTLVNTAFMYVLHISIAITGHAERYIPELALRRTAKFPLRAKINILSLSYIIISMARIFMESIDLALTIDYVDINIYTIQNS